LKLCHTSGLSTDQADHLAAIAAGMQSLAHGASMEFGDGAGGGRHAMAEFYGGPLFIIAACAGAYLAVIVADVAEPRLAGHHMNELVEQIGELLSVGVRTAEPLSGRA